MNFANPATICEAWYAVARSREIREGRISSGVLGGNRIALWRESKGELRALDARCAHLGADLTQGDLVCGRLRCPFHHWEYDVDGRVATAPVSPACAASVRERAVFRYPVAERFGLVWVWNGPSPRCALPRFQEWNEAELRATPLRSRLVPCHPHLLTSNGLDFQHWGPLHGLDADATELEESFEEQRVSAKLGIPLGSANPAERLLRWISGERVHVRFTSWSGNVATVEGRLGPFPLLLLFAMTPDGSG
ncbi:MAG: Rieske (2Fe-2S) protein, partial [Thermoanaerobaculia bacterium]|nr:Rieske (2Fe-2S) protein [Thermoanaerobaculia bacterium]